MRDRGTAKTKTIRRMRDCAKNMKSRGNIYKRIEKWEEFGIGTNCPIFRITLSKGYSFDKFNSVQTRDFVTVHDVMVAVHGAYIDSLNIDMSGMSDIDKLKLLCEKAR